MGKWIWPNKVIPKDLLPSNSIPLSQKNTHFGSSPLLLKLQLQNAVKYVKHSCPSKEEKTGLFQHSQVKIERPKALKLQ